MRLTVAALLGLLVLPAQAQSPAGSWLVDALAPDAKGRPTGVVTRIALNSIPIQGSQLPTPTSSVLGGVLAQSGPIHQFQNGINVTGAPTFAQPASVDLSDGTAAGIALFTAASAAAQKTALAIAAGDVSGLAASATTDATNASNISSGTLASARLPSPLSDTGITVGKTTGGAATPFYNMQTGTGSAAYDVQLSASGGTSTNGQGTLTLNAGAVALPGIASSGTATGTVCVSAGNVLYIKTTTGACL